MPLVSPRRNEGCVGIEDTTDFMSVVFQFQPREEPQKSLRACE